MKSDLIEKFLRLNPPTTMLYRTLLQSPDSDAEETAEYVMEKLLAPAVDQKLLSASAAHLGKIFTEEELSIVTEFYSKMKALNSLEKLDQYVDAVALEAAKLIEEPVAQ